MENKIKDAQAEFRTRQLAFLEAELKIEREQISEVYKGFSPVRLERQGVALNNMEVTSFRTGLGNKMLVYLMTLIAIC